jgi:hypothetical protein
VVQANDDSPVTELFRTLRNNLLFMLNEPNKKVVMVTSTVPGEGKPLSVSIWHVASR